MRGVPALGVQAAENGEDALEVFGGNADAVVSNREQPCILLVLCRDVNVRLPAGMELHGIADQVLEGRHQLGAISHNGGRRIVGHQGTIFSDRIRYLFQVHLQPFFS